MIDVVFLLIIFFLVSSHLARQDVRMELDLPSAATGDDDLTKDTPRVVVNVLPEGQITLNGRRVSADELRKRLSARRAAGGEDLEVLVRSDRGVPYGKVQPVMLSCVKAGVWNVKMAVHLKGGT